MNFINKCLDKELYKLENLIFKGSDLYDLFNKNDEVLFFLKKHSNNLIVISEICNDNQNYCKITNNFCLKIYENRGEGGGGRGWDREGGGLYFLDFESKKYESVDDLEYKYDEHGMLTENFSEIFGNEEQNLASFITIFPLLDNEYPTYNYNIRIMKKNGSEFNSIFLNVEIILDNNDKILKILINGNNNIKIEVEDFINFIYKKTKKERFKFID